LPEITLPAFLGERKNVGLMSSNPVAPLYPGNNEGWLITGMMVRVIKFQSSFK